MAASEERDPRDLAYAEDLRAALLAADYTYDGVMRLLGEAAHRALLRNETTPASRRATGDEPLATLVRLWLLQREVEAEAAERALPDGLVDRLARAGILRRTVGTVTARVDVRPYATGDGDEERDWWVVADLTPGLDGQPHRVGPDHVLGISSAATSLTQLAVRRPAGRALDLGTGSGLQALLLADRCREVVATDVNERALWLARLNARLNGVALDVRHGSFFEPVRGERFDRIVTNPPFVISPATGERLVYRDSGLPGDRVVEHVVGTAPLHLEPGGIAQVLANWVIPVEGTWQDRVLGWVAASGVRCDAWVVQRERADLPEYVELWLKDAGLHPSTGGDPEEYRRRYDTWLSWYADQGIAAIGFGWIFLRRLPEDEPGAPVLRTEEWPFEVAQPLGDEVAAHFDRTAWLRRTDDETLGRTALRLRADVVQETVGAAGAEDPERIVVRQQLGMRRARRVDTGEAALVGACDGDLALGRLSAAVEELLGPGGAPSYDVVRELVADGYLVPPEPVG